MSATPPRQVDQNGLKVGQAAVIGLLVAAFIINHPLISPLLVACVALAQLLGALDVPFAPFRLLYVGFIKPRGLVRPNVVADNPEPHRFAMLVGALFDGVAALALFAGAAVFGWVLVGIVVVLANLNFWLNFCLGCWMYYQFHKLGIPGFTQAQL